MGDQFLLDRPTRMSLGTIITPCAGTEALDCFDYSQGWRNDFRVSAILYFFTSDSVSGLSLRTFFKARLNLSIVLKSWTK